MKVKKFLIAILACMLVICLAGCGRKSDVFEDAAKKGMTCKVTYDLGEGTIDQKSTLVYLLSSGSPLPELGVTESKPATKAPVYPGHRIVGYTVTDENGEERVWDFENDRVTGDMTVRVKWAEVFTIEVKYGEGWKSSYTLPVNSEDGVMNSLKDEAVDGCTFYGFFLDEECKQPITFPYKPDVSEENPTTTIYAKYIEGKYTIIRQPGDFGKQIKAGVNYYIDADIDLTGVKFTIADNYLGTFEGNGHTIKGLSISRKQGRTSQYYGLFARITSKAVFRNITFEDFSVDVKLDNAQNPQVSYIGAFAGSAEEGATFENVVANGTLTYDLCGREQQVEIGELFGEMPSNLEQGAITGNVVVSEGEIET